MFRNVTVRSFTQLSLFLLFVAVAINNVLFSLGVSKIPSISLAGICPVNGVTLIYFLLTTATVVSFITIGVIAISLLFGSVFCGWVCPLGALQDLVSKVAKKMKIKKYNKFIPRTLDRYLVWLRYIVLAIILYMSIFRLMYTIRSFCIYGSIVSFWNQFIIFGGLGVLVVIFIFSLFITERPWCKYLCPYGLILGMSNRISIFRLTRTADTCINCKKCDKVCPMNVKISERNSVLDASCISCLNCTSENICPIEDTVSVESRFFKKVKIKQRTLSIIIIMVFLISFLVAIIYHVKIYHVDDVLDISQTNNKSLLVHDQNLIGEQTKEKDNTGSIYMDGVYDGIAVAYRPGLRVRVSVMRDEITDIEIISHRESKGYFEEAFEVIPKQILERQSIEVDAITGATETVDGIVKALQNALRKAIISK